MTTVRLPLNRYREKLIDAFLILEADRGISTNHIKYMRTNLRRSINEYGDAKRFKEWLFADGIVLIRDKKVWYLQFFDETTSSHFILQFS
jgi:hypothetical protein